MHSYNCKKYFEEFVIIYVGVQSKCKSFEFYNGLQVEGKEKGNYMIK